MSRFGKSFALFLIIIIAVSSLSLLLLSKPASAQSIPKPSTPRFTVYLVNHPYEVPPTSPVYTIDPYTGEQKLVNSGSPGYRADNITIELWIQNEQPTYLSGSTTFKPYYDVRTKGHFDQNWTELYAPFQGMIKFGYNIFGTLIPNVTPTQSNSVYTVISYSATSLPDNTYAPATYPPNATVDFQVAGIIGHNIKIIDGLEEEPAIAFDVISDWSNTQAITLSNSSISSVTPENSIVTTPAPITISTSAPTLSPALTSTPTVPEFPLWTTSLLLIIMMAAGSLICFRRYTREKDEWHE